MRHPVRAELAVLSAFVVRGQLPPVLELAQQVDERPQEFLGLGPFRIGVDAGQVQEIVVEEIRQKGAAAEEEAHVDVAQHPAGPVAEIGSRPFPARQPRPLASAQSGQEQFVATWPVNWLT